MIVTPQELKERLKLPLEEKIKIAVQSIKDWYIAWDGMVYVSFSGGKDSTVLLDIVRSVYPEVPAVFSDTGLEYPEIKKFVKTQGGVTTIRPVVPFHKVIKKWGYPVISKKQAQNIYETRSAKGETQTYNLHMTGFTSKGRYLPAMKISEKWKYLIHAPFKIGYQCCNELKKKPFKIYEKQTKRVPYVGMMATDSRDRARRYLMYGCNHYGKTRKISSPLSIFTEHNIWDYIKTRNLPYSKIYDMGYSRTGCTFCMFGAHLEKEPNKFQIMQKTHPKLWDYCINKLGCGDVLRYIHVPYEDKQLPLWEELSN